MRWIRTLCLGALVGVFPLACSPSSDQGGLVLIVVDTLRADHVGFMGYPQASTPHLDALAARGTAFTRALTPVPVTLPAVTSLLTGRLPATHGVRDNTVYVVPDTEVLLSERSRAAGWRTGAVLASAVLGQDRGLAQGFETFDDAFAAPYPVYAKSLLGFQEEFATTRRRADTVTNLALERVQAFGDDPFLLLVHYFDVHSYYDPPPRYRQMHPKRPYDGEVSFVDSEIGRLLQGLTHRPDVTVMVVADHGEGLHEHGETEHGFLLYQTTLHVPLVVTGPGIPSGLRRDDPVSLIDLEPTLAQHFGWPDAGAGAPGAVRDGRVLSWAEPDPDPPALYAETMRPMVSYHWSELRAVLDGADKLIRGEGMEELFDLAADPGEMNNLREMPEAAARAERLGGLLDAATDGETRQDVLRDLAQAPEPDPARKELLESLGYIGGESGVADTDRPYPHPAEALPAWVDRQRFKAMYRNAVSLAQRGQMEQAFALFDSVLARDPAQPDVYYNLAVVHRQAGHMAEFEANLARALELDPGYVPAHAVRAAQRVSAGTPAPAAWQPVLDLDPKHEGALREMAKYYLQSDAVAAALPYLRRLAEVAPQDAQVRFNLGLAASRTGNAREAKANLEAFLRLAPEDPRGPSVRQMIDDLE